MSDGEMYYSFFDKLADPTAVELAELDAGTLLRLLRGFDKADVARFGRDMAIPVGRKNLNLRDADRLLVSLRVQSTEVRMRAAAWLTSHVRHPLMHALLESGGWEPGDGHECPTLVELADEWGPAVLRLALIASYRTPMVADRLVAAAIVDGTLIAPDWADAADAVGEQAAEVLERFLEAMEVRWAESHDDANDADEDEDGNDGGSVAESVGSGSVGFESASSNGAGAGAVADGDPAGLTAGPGEGNGADCGGSNAGSGADRPGSERASAGEAVGPDGPRSGAAPAADAAPAATDAGGADTGSVHPQPAPIALPSPAEAMQSLADAVVSARAALAGAHHLTPFARLETLGAPDGEDRLAGAVRDQLAEVWALATGAAEGSAEGQFLAGLADLVGRDDPVDRMAAGMALLADPVGAGFPALLMAAAAGHVALGVRPARPMPFDAWVEVLARPVFDQLVAEWSPVAPPAGEEPVAADVGVVPAAPQAGDGAPDHDGGIASGMAVTPAGDRLDAEAPAAGNPSDALDAGGSVDDSTNPTVGEPDAEDQHGPADDHGPAEGSSDAPAASPAPDTGAEPESGHVPQDDVAAWVAAPAEAGGGRLDGDGVSPAGPPEGTRPEAVTPTAVPETAPGATVAPATVTAATPGPAGATGGRRNPSAWARTAPVTTAEAHPDAGEADDEDDAGEEEDDAGVWSGLFAAGRWSLAAWLARAGGDDGRAAALETVAVIDSIRSGTGVAANALYDIAATLEPAAIGGDEPVQLLAFAAAMRASLVAPFAGTVGPLGYLGSIFAVRCPSLATLSGAARTAAESGLALAETVAAPLDESERAAAARAADEWLARPRHTTFERADRIWGALAGPGGLIGELLRPAAADNVGAVDEVRSAIAQMSPSRIDAELRAQDNRVRRGGSKRLEGMARSTLQRWCDEAIRLASAWVVAADAARVAAPGATTGRHQAELAALRRAADAERAGALVELRRLADGDDIELAGAATGACRLLEATLRLIDGTPLPGAERSPELVGRVDLLRTRLPLDATGRPVRLTELTPAVAGDVAGDWAEAFARRVAVYDFAGSAEVIELARAEDPAAAAALDAKQEAALAAARSELRGRRERLQADLEAGRRNGVVDENYAATIDAYLIAADVNRSDLGAVRAELHTAAGALRDAAAAASAAFAERLTAVRAERPDVAEAVRAAANLAAQGDLATAEETLIQGLDGAEPVTEHRADVAFAEFFPAVVDDLAAGIDSEVVEAAANRSRFGTSLDFAGLSAEAASSTARALSRWRDVAGGDRRMELRNDLAPALRLLGIGASGERAVQNLPRSAERAWIDLTGVDRTGQRLVPAFGSAAGTEQRLLLVWRQPPPETLLSYLEQDPSDRSVIVCYFGTMPGEVRRDLARRLRRLPAGKAVVIVDDAVVAWAAAKGLGTFEVTMRATLPFSAVNPYLTGHRGAIPEEMFYGRVAERQAVMAEVGTNLIYGGRRLGKSALLHEAGRRFEETPGQVAVYVDLDPASIRATRRADALWHLVAPKLAEKGVVAPRSGRRRITNPELVDTAVRSWLEAHPGGRLLLALDECDAFFDADGANNFAVTRTLKEMMERDRRFKVVFAGLHQVQRFATIPNQPFAHLGRSVPIGPLAPRYGYSLLAKPLLVLGWELSPELASRVLAYTNYLPILLQEVGHALVELLQSRPCEGPLPAKVTAADIGEVLSSEALAAAIHERFTLTLNLDPRYTVISYVVALEAAEEGVERTVAVRELRSRAGYYWPAGFADVREDEFRALLEELVGLGILARSGGAYRMRSPNVLRLLGSREEIEDKLLEVADRGEAPSLFAAGDTHRALDPASGVHSPLTETQLADVVGVGTTQLRVVVGTDATGVEHVGAALEAVERDTATFSLRRATKPAAFTRFCETVPERSHHVVLDDLRNVGDDSLRRALTVPGVRLPAAAGATRSAVIVVGPEQLPIVESVLGDDSAGVVVALGRYSPAALRTWALNVEGGFSDPAVTRQVMELTGGWPVLLDRLALAGRARGAAAALEELRDELAGDPSLLLAPAGLDGGGLLACTFAQLVDLLDGGAEDAEIVADLLSIGDDVTAAAALRAAAAAGVVTTSTEAKLYTERVVTATWRASRDG